MCHINALHCVSKISKLWQDIYGINRMHRLILIIFCRKNWHSFIDHVCVTL